MRDDEIEAPFAGGIHRFRLTADHAMLWGGAGRSPIEMLARLVSKTWHVRDIEEPIKFGLVGVPSPRREGLLRDHLRPGRYEAARVAAIAALGAFIYGVNEKGEVNFAVADDGAEA